MVQLANLGKSRLLQAEPPLPAKSEVAVPAVKLEIEDPLEEEHGALNKKPKVYSSFQPQQAFFLYFDLLLLLVFRFFFLVRPGLD